jgi:polyphenol oxidase
MTALFIEPNWPAPKNIKAYSSLRASRISLTPSHYSIEKPNAEKIDKLLLKKLLNLPNEPIWLTQTHSTIAVTAASENQNREADASYSHEKNQICAVLTADCLPILICDKQGTTVAAIHAGWRGLAHGILEQTFEKLHVLPENTLVWLGPAIGPEKFVIREDVYRVFVDQDQAAESAFQAISADQWLANIYTLARLRCKKYGITQIYGGEHCTFSDSERFFSYRREQGVTGRNVSLIWIQE